MENLENAPAEDRRTRAMRFLRLTALWSEAFVHGEQWVRSQIADLKIDLSMATEQGERDDDYQVQEIQNSIEFLERALKPSPFNPVDEDGSLSIKTASADLARYALCIVEVQNKGRSFLDVVHAAVTFVDSSEGRSEAYACLERVLDRPGVILEDALLVQATARRLLEQL